MIAEMAAQFVRDVGIMRDGFSFQAGAGGTSLAFAIYLKEYMKSAGVKPASFAADRTSIWSRCSKRG